MSKTSFKELKIWQDAKDIAVFVYKITNSSLMSKDYSLKEQMRRSAISIASNISEGNDRDSNKDFIKFLYISKGSCAELLTQICIAKEISYIDEKTYSLLDEKINIEIRMIGSLIRSLSKTL